MISDTIRLYEQKADEMADKFLSLTFAQTHPDITSHFPHKQPMAIADIGAGAGRDALALAQMGHYVMAVEPSAGLRARGQAHTKNSNVIWADDALPDLYNLSTYPQQYDFILCNGVWMHLDMPQRHKALSAMAKLLTPWGRIYIKAFDGTNQQRPGRAVYPFTAAEFADYAPAAGLKLRHQEEQKDLLGKADVRWFVARLDRA